jgi:hypothetical protein
MYDTTQVIRPVVYKGPAAGAAGGMFDATIVLNPQEKKRNDMENLL